MKNQTVKKVLAITIVGSSLLSGCSLPFNNDVYAMYGPAEAFENVDNNEYDEDMQSNDVDEYNPENDVPLSVYGPPR